MEDWNEVENDDQEERYPHSNIPTRHKEKQQHCRPEFSVTKNYIKNIWSHQK